MNNNEVKSRIFDSVSYLVKAGESLKGIEIEEVKILEGIIFTLAKDTLNALTTHSEMTKNNNMYRDEIESIKDMLDE